MYKSGEMVVYGSHGVCRVVGTEKQMVDRKRIEFLILEPTQLQESRFYIPTQNPAAMAKVKPVLLRHELAELLSSSVIRQNSWVQEENTRKQLYRDLISSSDRVEILKMVFSLYRFRDQQAAAGRKFHLCDENFLRDAERLLSSEIALVMGVSAEEARDYLRNKLQ